MLTNFFTSQILLPLLGTVITGFIGWASTRFSQLSGIQIEAKHRDALHSALLTGVKQALAKFGPGSQANTSSVIAAAVEYAKGSVPDAIAALKPSDLIMGQIATSKVVEAKAQIGQL